MYIVENASQAETPGSPSNRRVINVSGTRLYPTEQMQVEELTSDVLKGLRSGDLRVHRENGARVTEETLRQRGLRVEEQTQIVEQSAINGSVRQEETILRLVDSGTSAEQGSGGSGQSSDEGNESSASNEPDHILPELREAGAIDESVSASTDMNAKPLRVLIGEYGTDVWPEGFFDEEDRVTVERALKTEDT